MLKLREVLWEITAACDKNCDYCGSKDIINKKDLDDTAVLQIAAQLAAYVEEVTLTGGEPGLLHPDLFNKVVQLFVDSGVRVKVITSGRLFAAEGFNLQCLDVIGVSINTPDDVAYMRDALPNDNTMITNFGKHNIWDFTEIEEMAEHFKCWQVQLTMGEQMLNADGIIHLREKLANSYLLQHGVVVVLADNLQVCHQCAAGMRSCGITYTGDVIACLSERSYGGNLVVYGNLLQRDIKDVWENEFKDARFTGSRQCCRDYVTYPQADEHEIDEYDRDDSDILDITSDIMLPPRAPSQPHAMLYGVSGGQIMVYGSFSVDD
jgi:MoaA/NifB/PqqE/SkfB family radical SAM enzyme